jgi:hypothetical protein
VLTTDDIIARAAQAALAVLAFNVPYQPRGEPAIRAEAMVRPERASEPDQHRHSL